MAKKQPIQGRGFGGRNLTKKKWQNTKKQRKLAERYQPKYPTPTNHKPTPVQMQKPVQMQIAKLRGENQSLTKRIAELKRQIEELTRTQIGSIPQPAAR